MLNSKSGRSKYRGVTVSASRSVVFDPPTFSECSSTPAFCQTFTDDPLTAVTPIKAVHITEICRPRLEVVSCGRDGLLSR